MIQKPQNLVYKEFVLFSSVLVLQSRFLQHSYMNSHIRLKKPMFIGFMGKNQFCTNITIQNNDKTIASLMKGSRCFFVIFNELFSSSLVKGISLIDDILVSVIYSNLIEGCIYIHIFTWFRRKENEPHLQKLLSDEEKRKRTHRFKISLQMNVMSWILEFLAGILMAFDQLLSISNSDFYSWMFLIHVIDIILCGIIVPCVYILQTEKIKNFVYTQGWMKTCKMIPSS